MRNMAKNVYHGSMDLLPHDVAVRLHYYRYFGRLPCLAKPMTFSEKNASRKLHQRDRRFTVYSDKYRVKSVMEETIGAEYVIKTLWAGERPEDIPFDELTPPYVLKATHSSDCNIFIREQNQLDKKKAIFFLNYCLKQAHGRMYREWGYVDIPPRILAEEMILSESGAVPNDYKFFVYHGRTHFIQGDFFRFTDHRSNIYDADFNLLPIDSTYPRLEDPLPPKPSSFDDMKHLAERIGQNFDFCRVDLYSTPTGVKFGEVTFYPGAGHVRYFPEKWDRELGAPWKLPDE